MAEHERRSSQRKHDVIEHHGAAAKIPDVDAGIIGNRKKQSDRAAKEAEMIEADSRELSKRDGKNGKIHSSDAEPKRKKTDCRAAGRSNCDRGKHANPWPNPEMYVEKRGGVGPEPHIDRVSE